MATPHPTAIERLARSWDDLVVGNPPDSDIASTADIGLLRAIHRLDRDLDPDPHFVADLQRELIAAWQRDHRPLIQEVDADRRRDFVPIPPEQVGRPLRRYWHVPHHAGFLASAALLLLTLVSAIGLLAPTWQPTPQRGGDTNIISAPTVHDPATAIGVLTSVRVPELPPSLALIGLERWTYPPHADAVTTQPLSGPLLLYVLQGEVTVALNGGEAMLLGEEHNPLRAISSLNTSTGRVGPGQTLLLPAQTQMTTSNPDDREAILIAAPLIVDHINDWVLPFEQRVVDGVELATAFATFPRGPAVVTLQRANLEANETLPAPPDGTIQLIAAESRYLAYLRRDTDGSVTNLEKEPLGILILTVTGDG